MTKPSWCGATGGPEGPGDPPDAFDPWDDVSACIAEIEWFATRKKDLSSPCERQTDAEKTWADVLLSDIKDLREAIVEARAQDNG
jgi:hypothetical protein